jgi:cysteine desulfurase
MIYLDHQASTTMHPAAIAKFIDAMQAHVANPHASDHAAGWSAADAIEQARGAVAAAVNVDSDEILFTSGATEADNIALLGVCDPNGRRNKIIVSEIEHKAVLGPARELVRQGLELVIVPVSSSGVVDPGTVARLVDDRTLSVSVMLVNNEIGTVQPIAEIAAACHARGALFHVDAAQALGWLTIDADTLGADLMSFSGHKMGGPNGIGALMVRRQIANRIKPIMFGGEQENGLRPGTLPTALCAAFGEACAHLPAIAEVDSWRRRTGALEQAMLRMAPGSHVNGAGGPRHPGCLSITFANIDAEALVARLQPHVAVSRGSACTSGTPEPSHVLRAIGLSAAECDRTLRISTGRFTTDIEIDVAIQKIGSLLDEFCD